jgi:Ca-activated chloride channel family protein
MTSIHAKMLSASVAALLVLSACTDADQTYGKAEAGRTASAPPPAMAEMSKMADRAMYAAPQPAFAPRPAVVETEKYTDIALNGVKRVADEPVSTFSIDVDTAAYANMRRFINDGHLPPRDAVRVEELVNYFDYGYQRPANAETPFRATTALVPSPWSKDRQILHVGVQGYELPQDTQPPLNLVFLIDTSGSMHSEDKLPLAQKAMNLLIDQLDKDDHVAIVAYAGSAGEVLAPTDGNEKRKIREALNALQSGGSTAGGAGLALAYALAEENFDKKSVNRVILLTDGDFNVGINDPEKLEDFVAEKRKSGIYLSTYGFGRGNYNDAMMQVISQTGNGTAGYIDTMQEARKLLRDDLAGSLFPIADDVKIQIEFNPAVVAEYRLIGYETRMLNREDFNNDKVDAGEVGSGTSVTALYEITPVGAKTSSDPLRYQTEEKSDKAAPISMGNELAFLKIRYKAPGATTSNLIEQPISNEAFRSVADAPEATRWALAVAGFGERLRGSPWVDEGFGFNEIGELAQKARGLDEFGLRAEFVQLVRNAKDAKSVNE